MENSTGHGSRVFLDQLCTGGEDKRERTVAKINPGGTAAEKEVNGSRKVGRQVQPMPGEPGVILMAHLTRKDQSTSICRPGSQSTIHIQQL